MVGFFHFALSAAQPRISIVIRTGEGREERWYSCSKRWPTMTRYDTWYSVSGILTEVAVCVCLCIRRSRQAGISYYATLFFSFRSTL